MIFAPPAIIPAVRQHHDDLGAAASMSRSGPVRERLSLVRRPGKKSEVTLR